MRSQKYLRIIVFFVCSELCCSAGFGFPTQNIYEILVFTDNCLLNTNILYFQFQIAPLVPPPQKKRPYPIYINYNESPIRTSTKCLVNICAKYKLLTYECEMR